MALGLLALPALGAGKEQAPHRPNIVFIELDDLTYTYARPFGCQTAITPTMDRLAREGLVFDQAMCQGMMCGPSRNCLISGAYPHQLGFYRNGQMKTLKPDAWLLPAALQRAGYYTAWIGKSHLRPARPANATGDYFNAALGFDHSLHTLGRAMLQGKAGSRPNPYMEHLKQRGLLERYREDIRLKRNSTLPEDDYLDGWFARLTVDFIRDYHAPKPLFLWVNFSLPHGPYDVPDAYHTPFADKPMPGESKPVNYTHPPSLIKDTKPSHRLADTIAKQRGYHAAIYFVDRQVGRIIKALEARGMLDDTWIVFFSDHGIMEGAHGLFHKGTLFRQVTQPALIIRGPAGTPRGKRVSQPVELTDLLPTFLEVAGSSEHAPAGISLRPVFEGKPSARKYAFSEIEGWVAVSDGHYRLIRSVDGQQALLFDELKDPENLVNLAANHPAVVKELSAAIDDWFQQTGPPRPPRSQ
jgi:arylsulfatase A-like enzyme